MTFIKFDWRSILGLTGVWLVMSGAWAQSAGHAQSLPTTRITFGMHNVVAQVAHTPEQRQTGLMFRKEMPSHEGMLFVFERPAVQCFWMKNTLIPLTAAFVSEDGTIVNLADMTPLSETSHCSAMPVRFVLETNQGWFAKRNIKAGDRLGGPAFSPSGSAH